MGLCNFICAAARSRQSDPFWSRDRSFAICNGILESLRFWILVEGMAVFLKQTRRSSSKRNYLFGNLVSDAIL